MIPHLNRKEAGLVLKALDAIWSLSGNWFTAADLLKEIWGFDTGDLMQHPTSSVPRRFTDLIKEGPKGKEMQAYIAACGESEDYQPSVQDYLHVIAGEGTDEDREVWGWLFLIEEVTNTLDFMSHFGLLVKQGKSYQAARAAQAA